MKLKIYVLVSVIFLLVFLFPWPANAHVDPLIRIFEGYAFHQAMAELIPVASYAFKHRDYLDISDEQTAALLETMELRTYIDQWVLLESRRDTYTKQMRLLTYEQKYKIKRIRYLEQPLHELLITPSVQREIYLTESQKDAIRGIFLAMRGQGAQSDMGEVMAGVLNDRQRAVIERKKSKIPTIE